VIEAASPIFVESREAIRGRRVLVIEDGPTLTHGEMAYGAGVVAAKRFGAAELVDPRPYAVGSLVATYQRYPHDRPGAAGHGLRPGPGARIGGDDQRHARAMWCSSPRRLTCAA
jgi:hypothetical protein